MVHQLTVLFWLDCH